MKPTVKLTQSGHSDIAEADLVVTWRKGTTIVNEIIEVGEYVVTVEANGADTYGNLAEPTKSFWVLKAPITLTTPPILAEDGTDGVTWATTGFDLLTNADAVTPSWGTVKYFVKKKEAGAPAADAQGWTTDAPHVSDAGTYYVYCKVDGDASHKALAPTIVTTSEPQNNFVIKGEPIPAGWSEPTTKSGLTFDNTQQELINKGTNLPTEHGKFMYKLGDDGTWGETVPTAKNHGTYTVYWKIVGNERYAGNPGGTFSGITIATVDPNVQATAKTGLKYTGKAQSLITVTTAYGAAPTYTIYYRANTEASWGTAIATDVASIDNVKGTDAGFYKIVATVAGGGNYDGAHMSATVEDIQIAKAVLKVSAAAYTKTYGEADPAKLPIAYDAFKESETAEALIAAGKLTAPTAVRTGAGTAAGETAGEHPITLDMTSAKADNYTLVYDEANNKKMTINPKDLSVATGFTFTPTSATPTYNGEEQTIDFTFAYTGGIAACQTMTTPADYAFVYKNNKNAGNKAEVIITGQGNFTGSRIEYFTINKKNIYIKPNNAEKTYGADDPHYLLDDTDEDWEAATAADYKLGALVETAPSSGVYNFVEDEAAETEGLKGTVTLAREPGENVSSYKIYVKGYEPAATDNYAVVNEYGLTPVAYNRLTSIFQIKASAGDGLVLRFKEGTVATKVYGEADPEYKFSDLEYVSGLVGEDKWDDIKTDLITPSFAIHPKYRDVKDNEANVLVVEGLASTNYPNVTVEDLPFTVTPRTIGVIVKSQTINYGQELDQTQNDSRWVPVDANSYKGSWNGASGDAAYTDLKVTLSTKKPLAEYGPKTAKYEKVIVATSQNKNYNIVLTDEDNNVWGDLKVNATGLILMASDDNAFTEIKANDGQKVNVTIDFNGRTRKLVNPDDDEATAANPLRTWKAGNWNALILPFDISVAELSSKLGHENNADGKYNYVVVNTIKKNADAGKFQFQLATGMIEANTPIMVKTVGDITAAPATATIDGIIDFGQQTIKAPASAVVPAEFDNGYKLVGQYAKNVLDKDNTPHRASDGKALYRFLYGDLDDFKGISSTSDNTWAIVPFDCYVDLSVDAAEAREVVFEFQEADGSTTVIKSVNANNSDVKADGWYTLNGVKLQSMPTEKGIYINNGKKVVIK